MIKSAQYIISSPDVKDCPQSSLPEYAFIGRSNVGKSSLINMLCHNPKLAKTSQKPGKTLLINHFEVESSIHISNVKVIEGKDTKVKEATTKAKTVKKTTKKESGEK